MIDADADDRLDQSINFALNGVELLAIDDAEADAPWRDDLGAYAGHADFIVARPTGERPGGALDRQAEQRHQGWILGASLRGRNDRHVDVADADEQIRAQ